MFFFFQAEDGIRDRNVTGVQTCALPIFEARVSFADLGLKAKHVIRHLNGERLAAEALATVACAPTDELMEAFRAELFLNDLALKREAMVYASLRWYRDRAQIPTAESLAQARSLISRLHGGRSWDVVSQAMTRLGVGDEAVEKFVSTVAAAQDETSRRTATLFDSSRRVTLATADAEVGLVSAPKPPGEPRFATPRSEERRG